MFEIVINAISHSLRLQNKKANVKNITRVKVSEYRCSSYWRLVRTHTTRSQSRQSIVPVAMNPGFSRTTATAANHSDK